MKRFTFALLLAATLTASGQTVDVAPATPAARLVQTLAASANADVRNFYAPNGYTLVWTRNGGVTPQAQFAIALLESASAKGLDPADYDGGQWTSRVASLRGDEALAAFDVALTKAFMRYASDVRIGRVHPSEVQFALDVDAHKVNLAAFTAQAVNADDLCSLISSIEPQHDDYRRLIAALAKYRAMEKSAKDDAALPMVAKLAPGQSYDALAQLAAILRHQGDLAANASVNGNVYEGAIVDAVKHFQSRHGLDADGVIGKTTFAQLNTPVSRRIEQIEWALERWRWIPSQLDGPAILVNIPEFTLRARGQGDELTMRVVVGKAAGHRTPVFDGDIKHVVFRPTWSVPPSIQRNEIAPKLARDGGYLSRNNFELVDDAGRVVGTSVNGERLRAIRNGSLHVRQKGGHSNALGLVKFLFPNDNNVYLHSTPQQELFSRARRDFSHGCIRVEDPTALAAWTLRAQPEWTKEKIAAAMRGKQEDVYVKVERPIAVYILYATAVAAPNGEVSFYDDIYGHDVQLAKVLRPSTRGGNVLVAAK